MRILRILVLISSLILSSSCVERIDQEVNIYLQNATQSDLEIGLTTDVPYRGNIGYRFSSNGGGYRSSVFQIEKGANGHLFTNEGFSESASQVTSKVFEIILVTLKDSRNIRISFSPDTVINYKSNVFSEDACWIFEKTVGDRPTQFRRNPFESHDYYFVIKEEDLQGK